MSKEIKPLSPTVEEVKAKIKRDREMHWYGIYVNPMHERKIVEKLKSRGIEAFVPTRREKRRWSDRIKVLEVVLTPSIIFARNSIEKKLDVFVSRDVKGYVHAPGDSKPSPISDESMQDFMRLIDANYEFKMVLPTVGDDVMVLEGPLKGLVGQLVKIEGDQRLVIRLNDAFGAAVKLDALSVNKVPKGSKSIPSEQMPKHV